MHPSLGREWEEGVEEERLGTQDPGETKIPELTRSLETTRGSASKCDPPSCRSDLSGDFTEDEDETCRGGQERDKMPKTLSPAKGIEQRPGLELHELSLLSVVGMEKPIPWPCRSELPSGALPEMGQRPTSRGL